MKLWAVLLSIIQKIFQTLNEEIKIEDFVIKILKVSSSKIEEISFQIIAKEDHKIHS